MLEREARAADVAAGRIGARDRPRRLLEAARVWRELARRTGDATALGRAAASARASAQSTATGRDSTHGEALCEQAKIAVLAAEMFAGPERLKAANEAAERALPAPEARALAARLRAIEAVASDPRVSAHDAAAAFEPALRAAGRGRSNAWAAAGLRCERAGVLASEGPPRPQAFERPRPAARRPAAASWADTRGSAATASIARQPRGQGPGFRRRQGALSHLVRRLFTACGPGEQRAAIFACSHRASPWVELRPVAVDRR